MHDVGTDIFGWGATAQHAALHSCSVRHERTVLESIIERTYVTFHAFVARHPGAAVVLYMCMV